ncbi:lactate utilization protein [Feifania hominis]|uniref:Lactate utilization protein n=1 Tax=Feifania hominis TaxID=2763660 RepID=A0A926DDG1_9FIRM|nr:lactate utilization protein [Feifania hominis]MBC8535822.1 lactate utilization protein [Feifania hominis]
MDREKLIAAFERNNYRAHFFETAAQAVDYLDREIDGQTVGFGDSQTLYDMGVYERLAVHNEVHDPQHRPQGASFHEVARECLLTDVFLTSVNAASESGILVNIDGTGNRVGGSLFSHRRVFFIFGVNKIAPTLEQAVWRARNIAAPLNAKRHGYRTPCAVKCDGCYDCASADRICNVLAIHYKKMRGTDVAEIVIINEKLGL